MKCEVCESVAISKHYSVCLSGSTYKLPAQSVVWNKGWDYLSGQPMTGFSEICLETVIIFVISIDATSLLIIKYFNMSYTEAETVLFWNVCEHMNIFGICVIIETFFSYHSKWCQRYEQEWTLQETHLIRAVYGISATPSSSLEQLLQP